MMLLLSIFLTITEVSLLEVRTDTSPQCVNYWTLTFNVWSFKPVCLVCGQQTVQFKCTLLDSVFLLICYMSERKIAVVWLQTCFMVDITFFLGGGDVVCSAIYIQCSLHDSVTFFMFLMFCCAPNRVHQEVL